MSIHCPAIYKATLPLADEQDIVEFLSLHTKGVEWLRKNGREDALVNVYSGKQKITFVLNDLETALLMRLSLQ